MDTNSFRKKRFGQRLKIARTRCDLTQKQLAYLLSCHQNEIAFYENGVRIPKERTLRRIADALDVDYLWLLFGDEATMEKNENDGYTEYIFTYPKSSVKVSNQYDLLNEENKAISDEFTYNLLLDQDEKKYQEKIEEDDKKYADLLKDAKTKHIRTSDTYAAGIASEIRMIDPQLMEDFVEGKKSHETIIIESIVRFLEQTYPDLYLLYKKDPTKDNFRKNILPEFKKRQNEKYGYPEETVSFSKAKKHVKRDNDTFKDAMLSDPERFEQIIRKISKYPNLYKQFLDEPTRKTLEKIGREFDNEKMNEKDEPNIDSSLFDKGYSGEITFDEIIKELKKTAK